MVKLVVYFCEVDKGRVCHPEMTETQVMIYVMALYFLALFFLMIPRIESSVIDFVIFRIDMKLFKREEMLSKIA